MSVHAAVTAPICYSNNSLGDTGLRIKVLSEGKARRRGDERVFQGNRMSAMRNRTHLKSAVSLAEPRKARCSESGAAIT